MSAFRNIIVIPRKLCAVGIKRPPILTPMGYRHLFSPAALGLDVFKNSRKRTSIEFTHNAEQFKDKMNTCLNTLEKGLVFTEDLKNTIYLAEARGSDIELVLAMAKKFNQQNAGMRFGTFVFGPLVMRLFHVLNQPDAAIQALESKELEGFFDQMTSYQIAMDILYKNERYEDALRVFDQVQERRIGGVRYPKQCFTLAMACCYKMNTAESLKLAKELVEKNEYGLVVNRRHICFVAALYMGQGRPLEALKALEEARTATHITIVSLKVKALAELDRVNQINTILQSFTELDLPSNPKWNPTHRILLQAIQSAEEAMSRSEDIEIKSTFKRIMKSLREHNMVSNKTIEDTLTEPINYGKSQRKGVRNHERERLAASFYPRNSRTPYYSPSQPQYTPRKGLMDEE